MCLFKWHICFSGHFSCGWISNINERGLRFVQDVGKVLLFVWNVHVSLCEVSLLQTCSGCAANSLFFIFFPPLSEALGTINPTDYSAPLLLDWTFTINCGRQQWGPDESNIHGISFTLLPLSHAPPPLCQAPVWWEGLLTLAAPIDRRFCKGRPPQPGPTAADAPPSPPPAPPKIGNCVWLVAWLKAAVWISAFVLSWLQLSPYLSKRIQGFFFLFRMFSNKQTRGGGQEFLPEFVKIDWNKK